MSYPFIVDYILKWRDKRHLRNGYKDCDNYALDDYSKHKESHSSSFIDVPKCASPLAFDDKSLLCATINDLVSAKRKVESNLGDINYVWQPQDVMQLVLLCKSYIDEGKPLDSTHKYYFLRYLESLVMDLNWYNGYCFEKNDSLTETEKSERKIVFDEINHLYSLANSVKDFRERSVEEDNTSKKFPGEDLNFDGEQGSKDGSHLSQEPKKNTRKTVIKIDAVPKVKSATVDADERLLHDLQNPHEELLDALNLTANHSNEDSDSEDNKVNSNQ